MKVILREDVDHLGKAGEVVKVTAGYARNFLLPKSKAMIASMGNVKELENQKRQVNNKVDKMKLSAEDLAKQIEAVSITVKKKVGENDKIFGSVTSMELAEALETKGFKIDKKKIVIEDSIKSLGEFSVGIKLHTDVVANFKVVVASED